MSSQKVIGRMERKINRGAQNVACVGGCVVVPGGVWGGISAGPRGLFSAVLAVG